MKFFTANLLRRGGARSWEAALKSYRSHLKDIRVDLPASVRRLSGMYFHDCELRRFEFIARDTIVVWLYGYKHYLTAAKAVQGLHRLIFKKASRTDLSLRHLSAWWGYEELDWTGRDVELRVLLNTGLGRTAQFHIRFQTVTVRTDKTETRN